MGTIKFNFTIQEYYKKGIIKPEDVNVIKEKLRTENLPHDSNELIGIFLLACNNNLEVTMKYAKTNYAARKAIPELFSNRDLNNEKLRKEWNVVELSVMPKRTEEGYAVIVFRFFDAVASNFHMDLTMKLVLMIIEATLYDEALPGFMFVVDLKNMNLKHITRLNFGILKRVFKYSSEGLIYPLKSVHYINGGFVLDQLYKMFKAFCKPELLELFRYYPKNMDWEDFYNNSVPRKCLPMDYGGELESMKDLHQKMWTKLEDMQEYFDQEYKHRQPYE